METPLVGLVMLPVVAWGISSFLDKVAVTSIGQKTASIVYLTAGTITLLYFALSGKITPIGPLNGVMIAVISGILVAIGGIGFYTAIQKENISLITPFVALYPAITVILGFVILHEKIKLVNAAGILLALVAGVLLAL